MRRFLAAVISASAILSAAHATIIFYDGNDPAYVDENILFRGTETAPMIQGVTNNTNELFDFYDAGVDLYGSQAEGQAMLQGADGQTFTSLTMSRDNPTIGFTGLILDIRLAPGERDGFVTFNTVDMGNGTATSQPLALSNGQNFFTIYTDDPDGLLTQVSFTTDVAVKDVRHVRIGGVQAVPEPASLACIGIGALALIRKRRRH